MIMIQQTRKLLKVRNLKNFTYKFLELGYDLDSLYKDDNDEEELNKLADMERQQIL